MWVVVLWLERLRSTFFHPLLASQACWWEDRDEPHWDMKLIGSHQSYASLEETFLLQRSCPSCKNANMFTYVDLLNSLSGFAFALEGGIFVQWPITSARPPWESDWRQLRAWSRTQQQDLSSYALPARFLDHQGQWMDRVPSNKFNIIQRGSEEYKDLSINGSSQGSGISSDDAPLCH